MPNNRHQRIAERIASAVTLAAMARRPFVTGDVIPILAEAFPEPEPPFLTAEHRPPDRVIQTAHSRRAIWGSSAADQSSGWTKDFILRAPTVNWSCFGEVDAATAETAARDILAAAAQARIWDADTGKDSKEVLKA